MPLRGSRRAAALTAAAIRSRRLRLAVLVSLLIHVLIGMLLLVTIRQESQPELLPPPSAVTLLFESGRRTGPTLPEPGLQATPPTPVPPPAIIPSPPPADVLPPPRTEPAPIEPAPVKPAPSEPLRSVPAPNEVAPTIPSPPAEILPPPRVVQPAPAPVAPPVPRPPPLRQPPKPSAQPKPPDFPAPMNYSFGTPNLASRTPPSARARPHVPGTIDMSLGPASRGVADSTPLSEREQDLAGADWRNELSRWVAEHAYYPEQARREAQEGDAKVRVLAAPNGQVKEVELIGKSGSMWLDLALLSLFRDQHIPRLPHGMNEPIEFNFTMHYILIRPR